MPIPLISHIASQGLGALPYAWTALKIVPCLGLLYLLKLYFGGTSNTSERVMHSKVVMITGGTSGIGAMVAQELAQRGAQIVLLTKDPPSDPFLADYIMDLRTRTNNELIYAEQVDLSSLHSIRVFATKWVDNAPPRRLDMLVLCANTLTPPFGSKTLTQDGVETSWGINYLANFHLLSILSPALRAQPPDRDVRVIFGVCNSYIGARLDLNDPVFQTRRFSAGAAYGASKLALMTFALAFQKHLDAYQRPDKHPNNARVVLVDPGWTRTPGMRRWLTCGSLWGLLVYLFTWPFWWLVLKSPERGVQSFLRAAMEAEVSRGPGGRMVKECRDVPFARMDLTDEKISKELWEVSEKQIEALEKEGAKQRAKEKKEGEEKEKKAAQTKEQASKKEDGKGSNGAANTPTEGKKSRSRKKR